MMLHAGDGTLTENEFVDGCMSDEAFVKVTQLVAAFPFVSMVIKLCDSAHSYICSFCI